jgi:hypothetical protein
MSLLSIKVIKGSAPEDRVRSCEDKVRYGHQSTAEQAVAKMGRKGNHGLESYACDYCGGWHIGQGMGWLGKTLFRLLNHLAE